MHSKEVIRPTVDKIVVFLVLFALLPLVEYINCMGNICWNETNPLLITLIVSLSGSIRFTMATLVSSLIVALLSYSIVMVIFWSWNKIVLGK